MLIEYYHLYYFKLTKFRDWFNTILSTATSCCLIMNLLFFQPTKYVSIFQQLNIQLSVLTFLSVYNWIFFTLPFKGLVNAFFCHSIYYKFSISKLWKKFIKYKFFFVFVQSFRYFCQFIWIFIHYLLSLWLKEKKNCWKINIIEVTFFPFTSPLINLSFSSDITFALSDYNLPIDFFPIYSLNISTGKLIKKISTLEMI